MVKKPIERMAQLNCHYQLITEESMNFHVRLEPRIDVN